MDDPGFVVVTTTRSEFSVFLKQEFVRWRQGVQTARFQPD